MPELNFQPIETGSGARTTPTPATQNTVPGGSSILGTLGSDAFLKLFVAQLKYQNPMEPMDGSQMLQQTSQFTQVETLQQLAEAQRTVMGYQQMATATALIGKQVTALDGGERVTAVVDSVQVSSSGPILVMGRRQVPLTEVVSVANAATAGTSTPQGSSSAPGSSSSESSSESTGSSSGA
jgi:flagellar basal-body rod modification protein FlgD